jgi:hypothetical protein
MVTVFGGRTMAPARQPVSESAPGAIDSEDMIGCGMGSAQMQSLTSGTLAGTGSFRCEGCGFVVTLEAADQLPACPACAGDVFIRASLFTGGRFERPSSASSPREREQRTEFVAEARAQLADEGAGQYLAYRDGESVRTVALAREWTRIGRSLAADVRFDDPTVSRRHALIVRQPDGVRVLDDRSLNGVFVNGERVEWHVLCDGDEILVGRYKLVFLELTGAETPEATPPLQTSG